MSVAPTSLKPGPTFPTAARLARLQAKVERRKAKNALAEEVLARLRRLDGALRVTIEDPVPGAELKLLEALGYTDVDQEE